MKFTNFCLIMLGDIIGAKDEITKISESSVNILQAKGLIIATFTSAVSVAELNDFFKMNKRNFILFEMNQGSYAAYINDGKDTNEKLFENIMRNNPDINDDMSTRLLKDIVGSYNNYNQILTHSGTSVSDAIIIEPDVKNMESNIKKMSTYQIQEAINELIDKGLNNLTDYDKKYLSCLTKKD